MAPSRIPKYSWESAIDHARLKVRIWAFSRIFKQIWFVWVHFWAHTPQVLRAGSPSSEGVGQYPGYVGSSRCAELSVATGLIAIRPQTKIWERFLHRFCKNFQITYVLVLYFKILLCSSQHLTRSSVSGWNFDEKKVRRIFGIFPGFILSESLWNRLQSILLIV